MENEITGEVAGSPADFAEKTERKPAVKRDAHCLVCSNEWNAINGYAKKPSKCPECHTRKCVWKDELPKTEEKTETSTEKIEGKEEKSEEQPEIPIEKPREESEKKREIAEKTDEKPKDSKNTGFFSMFSQDEKLGEVDDGKFQPASGLPILLVFGLLLVLGIVGGAMWFLGRRPGLGAASHPAVQRPATKAEGVAMRLAGGA